MDKKLQEKCQKTVLDAIKQVINTEKPEKYASMNYSAYLIAMKAVEIALTNKK